MAYSIDVFRRRIEPERDFIAFGVYVAYFPQLVAGPIERAQNLLPQIRNKRSVSARDIAGGLHLIVIGLIRKVCIADVASRQVDAVFSSPTECSSSRLLVAVLLFGIQIYGDFSGYSNMARGLSRLIGIDLMVNFRHPYFAVSITDFWRRWHISLSSWLRDYLYIPLGGNRKGNVRTYLNLMITMLLGGLWHGAAWTFVVWGLIHGIALACHKLFRTIVPPVVGMEKLQVSWVIVGWIPTMIIVFFAWIFFRASDFITASTVISGIAAANFTLYGSGLKVLLPLSFLMLLIDVPQALTNDETVFLRMHWLPLGMAIGCAVILICLLGQTNDVAFIYFQF